MPGAAGSAVVCKLLAEPQGRKLFSGLAHQNSCILGPNVSNEENEWDPPFGRVIKAG